MLLVGVRWIGDEWVSIYWGGVLIGFSSSDSSSDIPFLSIHLL